MVETRTLRFDRAVRAAMAQELERDPAVFAYGEGINDPGGFFGTTAGLHERFGDRCIDVPNSEEALMGFGLGAALGGLRPIFVNLRVEFLMLAANALVNHVAKWGDLQGRRVPVPFTIRAMVGRGWGQGAQHSGSYAAMLAHVPGLQVAISSGPRQAAGLLVAAVRGERPTVLIEPKAVYDSTEGVRDEIEPLALGGATVCRSGGDITLVAVGDTVHLALAAADELRAGHGVAAEVIDACSLAPFDAATIVASIARTGRVGVLDIGWAPFGLAAEVARAVLGAGVALRAPMASWAPEGHAPAGCFAEATHYPGQGDVVGRVLALLSS